MKRILHVEISSLEKSLGQFGEALEKVMQGIEVEFFEGIGFGSVAELLSTLTPNRWELIQRLKREEPIAIYALAKGLGRDYKNVRLDVKALEQWDIVKRDGQGAFWCLGMKECR